jgi:hypothetical protein
MKIYIVRYHGLRKTRAFTALGLAYLHEPRAVSGQKASIGMTALNAHTEVPGSSHWQLPAFAPKAVALGYVGHICSRSGA